MGLSVAERQLIEQRITNEGPSAGVAWLLLIFLGFLGAHRFYLGKSGSGIAMLLSMFILIGLLWWFIDLFLISGMIRERRDAIRQRMTTEALAYSTGD